MHIMIKKEKCICPPGLPYCACGAVKKGKNITKKPIIPTKRRDEREFEKQKC